MQVIQNPVLRGFNPDPSIIRVGDDYYIATSTFEWFPGVQIHHSRDLVHWELVAHPLNRLSQLNMIGNPDSTGVWAPCLSCDSGEFYLIYTNTKSMDGIFKDTPNYLVTSKSILGEWSEPVYLNSSGFDPSLFHDDDGRKWLVNMVWDHRGAKGKNAFGGILLQEYSAKDRRLTGPVVNIFQGTSLGVTEGPHLYKRNGYYYLMTAEGGTGKAHAVTLARSRDLKGPYEVCPWNPILTSYGDDRLELHKAGHASLVETRDGEWYLAHLCARPLPNKRCTLGRETAIQKVVWTDNGWLRLAQNGNRPLKQVAAPQLPEYSFPETSGRDDFDSPLLNIHFQTLRRPLGEDVISLNERKGFLRIKGHESLSSKFLQALVARRQQSFVYTAATCLEFEPETFQQMAGLVCYYNTENFYYLRVSSDEKRGKIVGVISLEGNKLKSSMSEEVSVEGWERVYLRARVDHEKLKFYFSGDGEEWCQIGGKYDASTLSDEYSTHWPLPGWGFTGAFVGICCQDLSGQNKHADFDYFEYIEG